MCGSNENTMFGRRQTSANSSTRSGNGAIRVQVQHQRYPVPDNNQDEALDDPIMRNAVECLLIQNLARAAAAQTEANRLANLLASSRGISTQEYMERMGNSGQLLERNEDLPPAYEDCVDIECEEIPQK